MNYLLQVVQIHLLKEQLLHQLTPLVFAHTMQQTVGVVIIKVHIIHKEVLGGVGAQYSSVSNVLIVVIIMHQHLHLPISPVLEVLVVVQLVLVLVVDLHHLHRKLTIVVLGVLVVVQQHHLPVLIVVVEVKVEAGMVAVQYHRQV